MTTNQDLPSREAVALASYMSELSEEAADATWLTDWEYILWRAIETGPSNYGRLMISEGVIGRLKSLSSRCGGWIVWRGREYWIEKNEWEKVYHSHENE